MVSAPRPLLVKWHFCVHLAIKAVCVHLPEKTDPLLVQKTFRMISPKSDYAGFPDRDWQIPNLMCRHKCGNTTNMRMSSWLLYRVARKASRFKMNKQVFQNMRTTTDYVLVNKLLIMNRFTTVSLLESRLKDCELNFVTRIIYAESSILDGCSHSKHNNSTINDARMVRFMKWK